jgi:hypothetical protein
VVKRLGTPRGVIQRVKGIRLSAAVVRTAALGSTRHQTTKIKTPREHTNIRLTPHTLQPLRKPHPATMHLPPSRFPHLIRNMQQPCPRPPTTIPIPIPTRPLCTCKQDPTLLKRLTHSSQAIRRAILVHRGTVYRRHLAVMK